MSMAVQYQGKYSSATWYSGNDSVSSWQGEKRYKWNKTEVQCAKLFSAEAVAKICSFRKINRCGKSLLSIFYSSELKNYE